MIDYIQGDAVKHFKETDDTILAHQSNCFGMNGAGFAGVLFKEFEEIRNIPHEVNESLFGKNTFVNTKYGVIINMHSQFRPGGCVVMDVTDKDSFINRLKALESCLRKINNHAQYRRKDLVIPLVASGIAADYRLKDSLTDLEYFKKYIAPIVNKSTQGMVVKVFYL